MAINTNTHHRKGTNDGRSQSPAIEHRFQDALAKAIKIALEAKGLYQKVQVNDEFTNGLNDHQALKAEFKKRPIDLVSRGEDENVFIHAPGGNDVNRSPIDEKPVGCYLPNIAIYCLRCKAEQTFLSLLCSDHSGFMGPYPIISTQTEQVFSLFYRCAGCREAINTFQLLRNGFQLMVTGRTVPYRPRLASEWPNAVVDIVKDASVATAEGDVSAGYYHLRTSLEFIIKKELSIPVEEQREGSKLCDEYNKLLDVRVKSGLPGIAGLYSELSAGLHSRTGTTDRFWELFEQLLNHFKARTLFDKSPRPKRPAKKKST